MRMIDIRCTMCGELTRDYVVGDTELSFDMPHACPSCEGLALRIPNTARIRGGKKGEGTASYLDGTKRAGFSNLLLENQLLEQAADSFDDGDAARLRSEAAKVASSKSTGQE